MGSDQRDTEEQAAFKFEKLFDRTLLAGTKKVLFTFKKRVWQIRLFCAAKLYNVVSKQQLNPHQKKCPHWSLHNF